MPSAVDKPTSSNNNNNHHDDDDENTDYTHLADAYNEPLYIYPRDDPTPAMKKAYASQKVSRQIYTSARKDREEYELNTSTELGQLYNSLRESNERERTVLKTLREKTIAVYDLELRGNDNDNDETNDTSMLCGGNGTFNQGITKLKSYIKKHKSLPDNLSDNVVSRELASWIENMQNNNDLRPHQRAALEHLGITFGPTNENDTWHRNLVQFQLYLKEYYETPIKVQTTNGNVLHSIALDSGSSSSGSDDDDDNSDNKITVLSKWCSAQQAQYELDGYQSNQDRYIKLVNAGFTFDVIIDDTKWDTYVEKVKEFKEQFGHVHVPIDYVPKEKGGGGAATATDNSTNTPSLNLSEFVTKVRTLILRDALSPNRLNDIKMAALYLDMGGRVHNEHITACKAGRAERDEEGERTKRKFGALEAMAATSEIANRKVVIRRNNMDNWKARLDSK